MSSAGYLLNSNPYCGALVPMGVLKHASVLYSFRLAYPTLCVGSYDKGFLWLWDIRTRELTQVISLEPTLSPWCGRSYMDINETHAFVATENITVYSRTTGKCALRLQASRLRRLVWCTVASVSVTQARSIFEEHEIQPYESPDPHRTARIHDDFTTAVRVSPSGDDFVVITAYGYIFHICKPKNHPTNCRRLSWNISGNEIDLDVSPVPKSEDLYSSNRGSHSAPNCPTVTASNDEYPLEDLRVSVAKVDTRLHSVAYDGNRIIAWGVSSLLLISTITS